MENCTKFLFYDPNSQSEERYGDDMDVEFAALLPMKGHSERVKNKNLRNFNGKPLFYYVLNTLMRCEYVSGVYIDTDSEEIAKQVKCFFQDVHIIERPLELCGDMVSMNAIIKHDMQVVGKEYYIQTHTTNPLLKVDTLKRGCELFVKNLNQYDSLFSVNRIQTRLYDVAGKAVNHDPSRLIRTQDLTPLYEENSNLYIFSRSSFMESNARIGRTPWMLEMDRLESIDIDEETDFILAEQIGKLTGERSI